MAAMFPALPNTARAIFKKKKYWAITQPSQI